MNLDNVLKFFAPKGMHISDTSRATASEQLTVTDVMAALGMTQADAGIGLAMFLGKAGISSKDREMSIAWLTEYAKEHAPMAIRKASGKKFPLCMRILARFAYNDYSSSAADCVACPKCSGKGLLTTTKTVTKSHYTMRYIDAAMKEFGITAANDQAMFIAQVGHESNGFTSLVENFNYSVEGLKKTFGKRLTTYQCEMLGRVDGKQVAHQPQIANLVYGDRMGNNSQGDGWKYRGRGLLQITGRENYTKCGTALKLDLVSTPELLTQERHAARSAAWYFTLRGCLLYSGDVERVTQIINGGQNGIKDRRERYAKAKAALV
ncbi:phage endolysin [Escherichia coli]|nr:phage endolysin [Escherichia coli]